MTTDKDIIISAIVSTYNSQKFIRGCLEDLVNQTIFHKTEVIVVDSGSKENEAEIVQEFRNEYSNIKYIRTNERETIYSSWNRAIEIASGKYITNANTDDRHRRDAFEILSKYLDKNSQIDIVYADQLITNIPNQTFKTATPIASFSWPDFDKEVLFEYCCLGSQPMWRKSLHTKRNIYFNESLEVSGDYDFWLTVAENNNTRKIHDTLGLYYKSTNATNKEYQNRYTTRNETYYVRRQGVLRWLQEMSANERRIFFRTYTVHLQNIVNDLNRIHVDDYFIRRIQHVFWVNSLLLEFAGDIQSSARLAREYFNFINDGYMMAFHLKDLLCKNNSKSFCRGPLVSIIIPIYNAEKFVHDTLRSIVYQNYKNYEIICIDDGSTDSSVDIVLKFIEDYKINNIYVYKQENSGAAFARNYGISKSNGKYILPLDADDCIANEYIAKTVNILENNTDVDIVFTEAIFFGLKNKVWALNDVSIPDIFSHNQLNVTALFKRHCWEAAGGYDCSLTGYEDWDFWITLAKKGFQFYRIPESLFFYRHTGDGRNIHANKKDIQNKWKIIRKHPDIYVKPDRTLVPHLETIQVIPQLFLRKKISPSVKHPLSKAVYHSSSPFPKILFVCHNFPPYNTAGAQLFALNLAKELKTLGHDVSFFYPVDISKRQTGEDKTPYAVVSTEYEELKVHQINVVDGSTNLFENPQYMFANESVEQQFEELSRREQFDLVHFHLLYRLSARLPLIAKSLNISTAATLHDYWLLCAMGHLIDTKGRECSGPESPEKCARCLGGFQADPAKEIVDFFRLRQQVNLAGYEALDRKYSPSKHLADVHARYGFSRSAVLPLGWPTVQAPRTGPPQKDKIVLGFIGQIVYRKGLDLLVKAVNGLDATLRDKCELHIHGTVHQPQFFDAVMETVKDNPGVKFFGPYTQDDLGSVLSSFDVTVIPSRQENYPLTVLESLSAKVPVIASDVGGVREMFQDKVEGFLFPREDTTRLTIIIRMLLAQPDLLATMRTKIRPVKTMRRNAEEYARVYGEMVKL